MAYSIEQQYNRDLDWYFKDNNNNLIHVTSAGGKLPTIIVENDELMDLFHSQIIELPTQFEIEINPQLEQYVTFETNKCRDFYLSDFVDMARRGFISIDKTNLGDFNDTMYHIVAYPKNSNQYQISDNVLAYFIKSNRIINKKNANSFDLFSYFEN